MMDCNKIQEGLIDYIDKNLSKDEEVLIRTHLDSCSECSKEYDELQLTIKYIEEKSKTINTDKEIKLNTKLDKKRSIRRITRTGFIAIALSFVLIVSAVATDMFGFLESWEKWSERPLSAWEQLINNGVGQELDISTIDNDVKVTVEGVISDELNTIILLKIEDLKGNNRLTPSWNFTPDDRPLYLGGDISNPEGIASEIPVISSFDQLYAEEENATRLMISTYPLDKEEGHIDIHINKMIGMIGFYQESEVEVEGNWDITIPVKVIESKTYNVNQDIDLDGNKLIIQKVTVAPTATNIQYTIDPFNKGKEYFINNITFSMKIGKKTYERSELSYSLNMINPGYGSSSASIHLKSIFLENPDEIDLMVNNYSARTRGFDFYDIDWDNLPQIIEFKGSKITVESIEYNEDSTKVIIKEDNSPDREYISSDIAFEIEGEKTTFGNDKEIKYDHTYVFSGRNLESEVRDSKGKVVDTAKEERWSDENYQYVFKQELVLSNIDFENMRMEPESFKENLKPGKLFIKGLNYKEFPNIKINIKLK